MTENYYSYTLGRDNYPISRKYDFKFNIKDSLNQLISELKHNITSLLKNDDYKINMIKNKLNKIANILESIKEFDEEFHDFLKIKKMLIYTLYNYDKNDDLNLFINLMMSFTNLVMLKINLLKIGTLSEKYNEDYLQFKSELKSKQKYFNNHIYKRPDDYDNVMIEVSKVLIE